MSKTLVLKPRLKAPDGEYTWHDKYVLGNAINAIAKGKDLMKMSPWISAAGKIEMAAEEAELGKQIDGEKQDDGGIVMRQYMPEIRVELRNQEATLLWKELSKLTWDNYGSPLVCRKCGNSIPNVPNAGTLYQMLADIANCLGEKMPEGEEDEPPKQEPEE